MSNVHMIVGSVVIIAFLVVLVLNVRLAITGTEVSWHRALSYTAATLLLVQYMLGFSLLGSGKDIPASHFILALSSIIPVGLEHGYASTREAPRQRGTIGAVANALTLVLVLIAYMIGQSN